MNARVAWRVLRIALWLGLCLAGWAIASLFGCGDYWVSAFLRGAGRIVGLDVTCEGTKLERRVLYAANHITWLDILAIGGAVPARFVAKSEIAGWPLVGLLAKVGGSVFVTRDRRSTTRAQADHLMAALRRDRPVVLFAEGGTGDGRTLDPFRAPLFVAAAEAGALVQPVAIDYGPRRADLAWPDAVGFGADALRIIERGGRIPVVLRFLPPLDPARFDRKALAIQAHIAVAGALADTPL